MVMNQQLLEQFKDYLINSGFTTDDVIPSELEQNLAQQEKALQDPDS